MSAVQFLKLSPSAFVPPKMFVQGFRSQPKGTGIACRFLVMKAPENTPAPILVIDDDPRVARILTQTLEEEGFAAEERFSAGQGYKRYLEGKHPVLLVDEALGRAKGLHLIRLIRLLDQGTTLILISGVADLNAAVAALRGGADDFISKPFKPWDLKARIQTAFNRRSLVARKARPLSLPRGGPQESLRRALEGLPPKTADHFLLLIPAIEHFVLRMPGFSGQVAEKAREAAKRLSVRESLCSSLGRAAAFQVLGWGGWEPSLAQEVFQGSRGWQDSWRSVLLEGADYLEALENDESGGARILKSAAVPAGGDLSLQAGREEEALGHLLLLETFFTATEMREEGDGETPTETITLAHLEEWEEKAGFHLDPTLARAFF